MVDDADLFLAIVPPALADDGTEYYDRKYLQIINIISDKNEERRKLTTAVSLRMTVGFLIKAMIFSLGPRSARCLSNCSISGNW